jgi:hypothetical protein
VYVILLSIKVILVLIISLLYNIIINAKWIHLLNLIILRIIKWPVCFITEYIVPNTIAKYCIFILVGAIITYLFNKYLWNKYFRSSPVQYFVLFIFLSVIIYVMSDKLNLFSPIRYDSPYAWGAYFS